jgi:hypothetical protein
MLSSLASPHLKDLKAEEMKKQPVKRKRVKSHLGISFQQIFSDDPEQEDEEEEEEEDAKVGPGEVKGSRKDKSLGVLSEK